MTDGITEAMRGTEDTTPTTKRRWHVAVGRPGDGSLNLHIWATSAREAIDAALWRGAFDGAEINDVSITEDPQ